MEAFLTEEQIPGLTGQPAEKRQQIKVDWMPMWIEELVESDLHGALAHLGLKRFRRGGLGLDPLDLEPKDKTPPLPAGEYLWSAYPPEES